MRKNLVVIILLCLFFNINLISAETKKYLTRTTYDDIYFVENGLPEHYMSDIQFHLSFDGKSAFCLDPKLQIKGYSYFEYPLSNSSYDIETLNYLKKVIYYGYDYINHGTSRYYMATQALIWEKLSPYVIEFYTKQYGYGDYIDVSNEKNEILSLVNNHGNVPYFANKSYDYNLVSNLEFKDDLLNNFEITYTNYNDVKIDGNNLKINNLNGFIGTINIKLKKKTYRNDEAKYYYLMDSQPMMTGGKLDDLIINLDINIKGAKIKLNKLDSNSKLPIKNSNIVFNIRNIDTNEYVYLNGNKDLKINNDGYLITDYLPNGTYEIEEISVEEGYKLNSNKLIKIDENTSLNNEILEVNFYNEKELGKIEITKIDNVSKNKIPNVEFEIYAEEDIVTKDGVIHYKKGEIISKNKTDKNGIIIFDNLVLGNYCIKETSTLNDYELNIKEHCFNLYENKDINITIENELKKGLIEIKKYGEVFSYLENKYEFNFLENIEFEIYASDDIITNDGTIHYKKDEIIDTNKTDESGIIIFDNLVLGNYCIREKYSNNNYIKNDKEYCFNLYDNINQNIEIYNYLKKVNLKINKLDSNSNLFIKNSNVVFNLKNIDTNEYIYLNNEKDLKLNEEGYLIINHLPYGNYELEEIKTDDEYQLNSQKQIIEINDNENMNNNTLEVNFYNEKKLGKIEINKIDNISKNKIENVEFEIYAEKDIVTKDGVIHYKKGEIISRNKTDKNGNIVFDNLILGKYCIKEVNVSEDYKLNTKEYCFNLYENKINNITIENELKRGLIKIKKYGEKFDYITKEYNFNSLENIEFEIFASNDILTSDGTIHYKMNEIIDTNKTDENGIIIFDNLVLGNYCIREKYSNNNYIKNDKEYCFNLYDNINQNIEVYNYLKKSNLKINKLDSNSNLFIKNSNVVFNLKSIDTNEYIYLNNEKDLKLNEEGYLIINDLPYGNYELEEIKTDDEYQLNSQKQIIEINDNTNLNNNILEVNFYNEKKLGKIEINKIDNISKNKIENVEFEIYSKEDIVSKDGVIHYKKGEIISKNKTDKNGNIVFDNLILGKYCIKEVNVPEDYKLNTDEYCFDLYEDKINNITIENELKKGQIEIKKYGEEFNYINKEYSFNFLQNIEFEIYASNDIITSDGTVHYKKGEIIDTKKTDENGNIVFDNLVLGKYCIREKNIDDKYINNDKEYCFNLYDNINQNIEVYNYLKKSNLKIIKVDSLNNNPLDNVEFEIFHNEQSLGKYITNEDGIIEISNLPVSIYEIKELVSKEGYFLNEESYTIDLNLNEEIIIENNKIIDIPNAMKNDYTNVLTFTIYIFGIVLFIYEKC